jgi:NAD(P)-dependent dehydrogenase (short-subunit alcohol dehydrogenase family)
VLLEGKVVVVSGIGPGLGRSVALGVAREGADVVLSARRDVFATEVAAEVESLGRRAVCVQADITSQDDCQRLVDTATAELGRIDVLVNNAFLIPDGRSFEDADFESWQQAIDVNLFGALRLTKTALPVLKEQEDSRVVMVNTMSVQKIEPKYGSYAASKGALATVTKTLALELGRYGVRVNAIHPGYIYGDSVEWYLNHLADQRGVTFQEVYDEIAGETCLGYLPPADEIAGAVVFFASPLARCITGQALAVNAGHWM